MNEVQNPYIQLSNKHLKRRLRQVERNLFRISSGRGANLDFMTNRAMFNTISDALNQKEATDYWNLQMEKFQNEFSNSEDYDSSNSQGFEES